MTPYTRRDFAKLALAAVPAAGLMSTLPSLRAEEKTTAFVPATGKPNSKVNGVQIGLNVPYSFSNATMSGDDILKNCIALGLSGVELRTQPVEAFLGAPTLAAAAPAPAAAAAPAATDAKEGEAKKEGRGRGRGNADPAATAAHAAALEKWRAGVSMDGVREFRKKYEDAGVLIEIVKVDGIFQMKDAVLDYAFTLAKTLGARAISTEISTRNVDEDHKRVGAFADKHQLMVGYHGHATTTPEHWEKAFALAKHNGANLDLGHFIAGNNVSVIEFLLKHHERITHVHVKDRRINGGSNQAFGQGDTPIVEVLRVIRDHKWPIQATIEFEAPIPKDSDRMTEIARAIKYCRDALA